MFNASNTVKIIIKNHIIFVFDGKIVLWQHDPHSFLFVLPLVFAYFVVICASGSGKAHVLMPSVTPYLLRFCSYSGTTTEGFNYEF